MSCAVSVHFPKPRHQGLRESSAYESGGALPTGKYDHVIVQPYYSRLSNDIEYGGRFFNQAVTYNPDVQFYVYAIWPKLDAADPAGETAAFLRQCEQTADGIMQRYPGHRPIRIIPVGSALLAVRNQIAAGGIPGLTSMGSVYDHLPETGEQDYGHLGDYGKYLGALVHFICIYHMHPGDLTNDIFSEWNNEVRTIPKEIADAFKEIAWTTVTGYPRSGVSDAAFSLVTTSLPNAYVSRQYKYRLETKGGIRPFTWQIASGTIPAGTVLDAATGTIAGTPAAEGSFSFTLTLTDAVNKNVAAPMTLQVSMPPAPELSNLNAEIWLNRDARLPLELSGGYGSRVSSVTGGALPAGLELNAAEAIVVGRPTQLGRFTATVTTTDEQNRKSTAQVDITVTEKPIAGVTYQYYVGAFETLPDFTTLMPMDAGVTNAISIGTIPDRNEGYALKFDGFLKITSAGSYRFFLNSDDGSRLFVADQIVIDNADGHSLAITHTGSVQLSAGYHALCLQYYQGTWDKGLTLAIEGPGVSRQNVPSSMLVFENPDTFGATPLLHPRTTTLLSKPSLLDQSDNFFLLNGARIRSPTAHSSTSVNGLVLVRKTNAAVSKKVLVK